MGHNIKNISYDLNLNRLNWYQGLTKNYKSFDFNSLIKEVPSSAHFVQQVS